MAKKKVNSIVNGIDSIPDLFFNNIRISPEENLNEDTVLDLEDRVFDFIEAISSMVEHSVKGKDYNTANTILSRTEKLIETYKGKLIAEITKYIPLTRNAEDEDHSEIESKQYLLGHLDDLYRDLSNSLQRKFMNDSVAIKKLIVFQGLNVQLDAISAIQPIQWKGTPAQLAVIFEELIEKDYIEISRSGEGEARVFLQHFAFSNASPSVPSLGRLFFKKENPLKDKTLVDAVRRLPKRDTLNKK